MKFAPAPIPLLSPLRRPALWLAVILLLGTAVPRVARAAVIVNLPTSTSNGSLQFTSDISLNINTSSFIVGFVFDEWVTSDGHGDYMTLSADPSAKLSYTLNGGAVMTSQMGFLYDNAAGYNGMTANDGLLFVTDYVNVITGNVLVLKAGSYTLPAGSYSGFNPQAGQTFTGNIYAVDKRGAVSGLTKVGPAIDVGATIQSGLQTAAVQDQSILGAFQGLLGDINGHLFSLRGGDGSGDSGGIGAAVDQGVVMGEGDGPEEPIAYQVPGKRRWKIFTTVNYANVSLSSIGSQNGARSQSWSPGVGIERYFTDHLALGFAASLLETHQSYSNGAGSLDMQGVVLSAYASYVRRNCWLDLLYSYGRIDLDAERRPAGFPTATGETTAWTNAVQLNGGWKFHVPRWKLSHGPFAGVDWLHVNVDSYSESGGGLAALAYGSRSFDSLVTRVGWSVSREFTTDFARITPQVRMSYERQNITRNNGTSASLINLPFSATGSSQQPGQDYLVAGAGVNFAFNDAFSLLITYQGQYFRQDMQAHYGGVRVSYRF